MSEYLLIRYDNQKPTHILRERYLPAGHIYQRGGFLFVPPELAERLGAADDTVTIGGFVFPAWRMSNEPERPYSGT